MKSSLTSKTFIFPITVRDRENFELIYNTYYHPLKLFISRGIPSDEAEDLLGDFFFRLWKMDNTFESEAHLQGYLYQSANNAMLDFLKSHRVSKTEALGAQDLHEFEDYRADMVKSEVYAELYRAINLLPSQCRTVISLSVLEGLNNKEIAKQMGIAEQSVKNTKVRAIQILKKNITSQTLLLVLLSVKD